MGNNIDTIKQLLKQPNEEAWFDFKENWFDPNGIGEYISAIANVCATIDKEYGYLIWGIKDKTHKVVGTKIDYKKDIKGEPFLHLLSRQLSDNVSFEFETSKIGNKRIVILSISAAKQKPVSFNNERYFRIGSSKVKLSKYPEKESMLWKSLTIGKSSIDNTISPKQNLTFNQLITYYLSKGIKLNEKNFKESLGFYTQDKQYNMLAYILSDNSNIPIRVSIFSGNDKSSALYSVKEFGNMCMLLSLEKIIDYGDTLNIMQVDEENRKLTRKDVPLYDIKSFREAVVNAFVHNKWVDGDAPQIEFYSDRVSILSHGKMLEEQTKEGFFNGLSKPVNKSLSTIFIQLHISEKTGRGVPTIVKAYSKNVFEFNDNSIRVTLPYNRINNKKSSKSENKNSIKNVSNKNAVKISKENVSTKINKTQEKILVEMKNNPNITTFSLMAIIGLGKTAIENNITELKKKNLIKRIGARKNGYWEIS